MLKPLEDRVICKKKGETIDLILIPCRYHQTGDSCKFPEDCLTPEKQVFMIL